MDARTALERDAVLTWLQFVTPGRYTTLELLDEYDRWSDRHEAPEIETTYGLGRYLVDLHVPRYRKTAARGYIVGHQPPHFFGQARRPLHGAQHVLLNLAPGRWKVRDCWQAYGQWAAGEKDMPTLSLPWFTVVAGLAGRTIDGEDLT